MSGCQQRPGAGLIHHSDRGVQYASHEYQSVLAAADIIASMSRKARRPFAPMTDTLHVTDGL